MAGTNLEIVQQAFEAFGRGDLDAVVEICDPEIVVRDPDRTGTAFRGIEGLGRFWEEWFENWQEYRVDPREFEEHGDEILVHAVQSGRGKLSGVELSQDFFNVIRLRDGKVVEYRIFTEREDALASLGTAD